MLEIIWGLKTVAILDVWTFVHVFIGISIGSALRKRKKQNTYFWYLIILVLVLSYAWELLEYYLELGLMGETVTYWFQGNEFWPNRFIMDPLMIALGYLIAQRFPKTVWPARALLLVWMTIHISIFPHSMYLQHIF
jgi:hypothetical protein